MSTANRDQVICHGCQNEWYRDEHGLECPECHSDFVEILENDAADPRDDHPSPDSPQHPLRDHNPWRNLGLDPNEEHIDRVAFSPAPGIHFERTLFRSGGPPGATNRSPNDDTVGSFFQALGGFMQPSQTPNPNRPPQPTGRMFGDGSQFATQNPFPHPHPAPPRMRSTFTVTGGGNRTGTWTSTSGGGLFPPPIPDNTRPVDPADPMAHLHTMMQTLIGNLSTMQGGGGGMGSNQRGPDGTNTRNGPASFADLIAQIMNPANAVHGDAVYSQEALDRIMNDLMNQTGGGSTAPGPASESAIRALPKKRVEKSMMGNDGKAECSVCMDNVEIGDEVTVLPCNHWFHEQCVGIWLKEHDTCPHCRQGIMPAEGTDTESNNGPRVPGQPPRHNTGNFAEGLANHPAMPFTQPGMQHPYVPGGYPSYPEPRNYVQPNMPPQPPIPPNHPMGDQLQPPLSPLQVSSSPGGRRHSLRPASSSSRTGSTSSRNQGEGSAGAAQGNGSGVSGWFNRLRGNRSSDS